MTQTATKHTILAALRAAADGVTSGEFVEVYLPNAEVNCTKHQFAGFLSALKADGLYISQDDDFFGMVKMAPAPVAEAAPAAPTAADLGLRQPHLVAAYKPTSSPADIRMLQRLQRLHDKV